MQARVKADYRWKSARSCGVEFVKSEWRPVPLGHEPEAQACLLLETRPEPEPLELEEIEVTESAREYAAENDIDLRAVSGSGQNGKITLRDVKAAA